MEDDFRIDALNERFAISGEVRIVAGNGGLAKVQVSSPLVAADIYLYGAQVTSWIPAGASEVLFLSERSHWQDGRAIRGGIPVCFPWFRGKIDDPNAPAHGVVRTRAWNLDAIAGSKDGSVTVTLSTQSDQASRHWWPHEFHAVNRIKIGASLSLELSVSNTGSTPFRFEEALHTYFRVSDVSHARVRGLNNIRYLDNMDGNREKMQNGDVTFSAPFDSAFMHTHGPLELVDEQLGRAIRTEKRNSDTTVVWNPWKQGAASLADLGDDEWKRMACVEASNILVAAIELPPDENHTMQATLSLMPT
jgi:glucose-6-phosphate 1-epimerase